MHALPRHPWLLKAGHTPGEAVSPFLLLERKLAMEASTGARCSISPTLQVPVPHWFGQAAHGYPPGVQATVLAAPTGWLPRPARTAAQNPETAAALATWLVESDWYRPSEGTWISPLTEAHREGVTEMDASEWLRGRRNDVLDAVNERLPEFLVKEVTQNLNEYAMMRIARQLSAVEMLLAETDPMLHLVEDEAFAQSSILAAGVIQLPETLYVPDSLSSGERLPLKAFIPSIGAAMSEGAVDSDTGISVLRICLDHAAELLRKNLE